MDEKIDELFRVCMQGNLDMVKKLLDEGIDVNIRDEHLWTPLMDAAIFERIDVIDELIDRGADINAVNEDGASSLIIVARNTRNIRIIKSLLDCGADYDIICDEGKKMIDHLPEYEKVEIEEYISNLPCDVKPARK